MAVNTYVRVLPMYDHLSQKLSEKISQGNFSVTSEYRSRLSAVLNSLNIEQAEQIMLLIIHHYFLTHSDSNPFVSENCNIKGGNRSRHFPYGIRVSPSGKGCSFDVEKLPIPLQALLGIYCYI